MPFLARWPGVIPPGVSRDDLTSMIDILPTLAKLAGTKPPADRIIDGRDILPILKNDPDAVSPHDANGFYYYYREQLQAVRSGPWKLYLPLEKKMTRLNGSLDGAQPCPAELYDVRNDISEQHEVSASHPDVVQRLLAMAEAARADLGDLNREGANQRPAGRVDDPRPQLKTE